MQLNNKVKEQMATLSEFGNIPIDYAVLESLFLDYKSKYCKIGALEKMGKIIRLKRGMYVVAPKESGKLLSLELIANHIYGPSYVSRETALRYYGLIPETVYLNRSMTTKHSRTFKNSIGQFEYTECSKAYFPIGIRQEIKDTTSFLIASQEKALCDLICYNTGLILRFQKDIQTYLEEDIRLDMDAFYKMDVSVFERCVEVCRKPAIIRNLIKILKK